MRSSKVCKMTPVEAMAMYSMLNKAGGLEKKSSFNIKKRYLPFYIMTIFGGGFGAVVAPLVDNAHVAKYNKDLAALMNRWPSQKFNDSLSNNFVVAQHNALRAAVFCLCGAGAGAAAGFLFVASAPITVPAYSFKMNMFDMPKKQDFINADQLMKGLPKIDLSSVAAKFGGPWP